MEAYQLKIYQGLQHIGEAIANFYKDGVELVSPTNTLASKANYIGHSAREIDSILRQLFAPKELIKQQVALLKSSGNKDINIGHFTSILAAIDKEDPRNALATRWFTIAERFHALAHRKNIHDDSKDAAEAITLWAEYEKILEIVMGSFLTMSNRLDVLLKMESPQPDLLPGLRNILRNRQYANYFYPRLANPEWLEAMRNDGFFEIPEQEPTEAVQDWPPIKYLLNIAQTNDHGKNNIIRSILDSIMDKYLKGQIQLHAFTADDILLLVVALSNCSFSDLDRDFFTKFSQQNGRSFINLIHNNMIEKLAEKLIEKSDIDGLENLLEYFLGFSTRSEPGISFFEEENPAPYITGHPNAEGSYVSDLFRRHGTAIMKLMGEKAMRLAVQRLTDYHHLGAHSITDSSPASIEQSSQTFHNGNWEQAVIELIRDYAALLPEEKLRPLISEMLSSKILIIQRIAIHLTRINYPTLKNEWWAFVDNPEAFKVNYVHEPYLLLQEHSETFSEAEFSKSIDWIERILDGETKAEYPEGYDYIAIRVRRWFSALHPAVENSKQLLADRNALYVERNSHPLPPNPEFNNFGQSFTGPELPLSFEEFESMNLTERIKYITEFVPEHPHSTTDEGLAALLLASILANPDKYIYTLDLFIPLPDLYTSSLINAFTSLLNKDNFEDYLFLLQFIENKASEFSTLPEGTTGNYHQRWLINAMSDSLITIASLDDKLDITKADAERIISILVNLLENNKLQGEPEEIRDSYINYVYNSKHGKLYAALISITSMYVKKFTNPTDEVKWPIIVKEHFGNRINGTQNSDIAFSITLGMHLPVILSWDKPWVVDNLSTIFNEAKPVFLHYRLFSMFSSAYLPGKYFYQFLKDHQLFSLALRHMVTESGALDKLMDYTILEWKFWQTNPEKDGLIWQVLAAKQNEQLKALVHQVWKTRILSPEQVLFLWNKLMTLTDELPSFRQASPLILSLFELLPAVTPEVFELASSTVSKIEGYNLSYNYLTHLYAIAETNYELAGKLLLQVYQLKLAGPIHEDKLKELVEKLYQIGMKSEADQICVLLSDLGSLVLKKIFNQNN